MKNKLALIPQELASKRLKLRHFDNEVNGELSQNLCTNFRATRLKSLNLFALKDQTSQEIVGF